MLESIGLASLALLKGGENMNDFDQIEIIAQSPLSQAIADGVLVKLCDIRFGIVIKPLVATSNLLSAISREKIMEVWNEYAVWRQNIMPRLKEEEQMFVTKVNNKKVWLIEDGAAFTVLYPEDY
jgi:hypothetical protein